MLKGLNGSSPLINGRNNKINLSFGKLIEDNKHKIKMKLKS